MMHGALLGHLGHGTFLNMMGEHYHIVGWDHTEWGLNTLSEETKIENVEQIEQWLID